MIVVIVQQAHSTRAVNIHTVATNIVALALRNQPANPIAKQSQPRSTRVTDLFGLLFISGPSLDAPLTKAFRPPPLPREFWLYRATGFHCRSRHAELAAARYQRESRHRRRSQLSCDRQSQEDRRVFPARIFQGPVRSGIYRECNPDPEDQAQEARFPRARKL